MTLTDYQEKANATRSHSEHRLSYAILGLCANATNIANEHRGAYRTPTGLTPEACRKIRRHAGDALWYISEILSTLHYSLEITAQQNLERIKNIDQPTKP